MAIYCMRFANPAEATGGFVGQRLGALRICKLCLGDHCGSLEGVLGVLGVSLEILGGPWGRLGVLVGCSGGA